MNITVIIPTYNRYSQLIRAVKSVYKQTYLPKELIVVDDGSNDKTSDIQKDFPSIKYIYQKNRGVSSARNRGIKSATYEWIAFLDSDDEWHIDKLKEQVSFHRNNPNTLISYTDEKWVRDDKEINIPKKYRKYGGNIFDKCLSHCIIAPSAILISKKLLDSVGLFDESLEVCEDYDLWLRISLENKIGLLDKKLITKYAGHKDQLSFKYWGMDRFRILALEKLLKIESKKIIIKETLVQKYKLLLKGAIKYNRENDIKKYRAKINFINI